MILGDKVFRRKKYLLLVLILIFGCAGEESAQDRKLWDSLALYETYIVKYRDPDHGYVRTLGYPHYLPSFANLYRALWLRTKQETYRTEYVRILDAIEKSREPDWTWKRVNVDGKKTSERSPLYNATFAATFYEGFKTLNDPKYRDYAAKSILGLKKIYSSDNTSFVGAYNLHFRAFCMIAQLTSALELSDPDLIQIGKYAYSYAISGLDRNSLKWFYDNGSPYDGHAAYYQLIEQMLFLENLSPIQEVFPDSYADLLPLIPKMEAMIGAQMLPAGTFYYNAKSPDYTEGAATSIWAWSVFDRVFATSHSELIAKLEKTILDRQVLKGINKGAYTVADKPDEVVLFYSDNIAAYLSKFLLSQ